MISSFSDIWATSLGSSGCYPNVTHCPVNMNPESSASVASELKWDRTSWKYQPPVLPSQTFDDGTSRGKSKSRHRNDWRTRGTEDVQLSAYHLNFKSFPFTTKSLLVFREKNRNRRLHIPPSVPQVSSGSSKLYSQCHYQYTSITWRDRWNLYKTVWLFLTYPSSEEPAEEESENLQTWLGKTSVCHIQADGSDLLRLV